MSVPSPYARFRRDHTRVRARLDALEGSVPARSRPTDEPVLRRHLDAIARQFDTHMAAEEAILYPLLLRVLPTASASLRPLHDEHVDLREMLAALHVALRAEPSRERDVQIAVQLRDFMDLLRAHIRKGESVVFDVSERVLRPAELRGLRRRLESFAPARERAHTRPEKGRRTS